METILRVVECPYVLWSACSTSLLFSGFLHLVATRTDQTGKLCPNVDAADNLGICEAIRLDFMGTALGQVGRGFHRTSNVQCPLSLSNSSMCIV